MTNTHWSKRDIQLCRHCREHSHVSRFSVWAEDGTRTRSCVACTVKMRKPHYLPSTVIGGVIFLSESQQVVITDAFLDAWNANTYIQGVPYPMPATVDIKSETHWITEMPHADKPYLPEMPLNSNPSHKSESRKCAGRGPREFWSGDSYQQSRVLVGEFTRQEWRTICARYEFRCLCCGRSGALVKDHIIPVVRYGVNLRGNIQPLCHSCNSIKNAKTIDFRPDFSSVLVWNLPEMLRERYKLAY